MTGRAPTWSCVFAVPAIALAEAPALPPRVDLVPAFRRRGLPVRAARRYRLRLLATAAPDFGIVRAELNGQPVGAGLDLYSGRVCPAGALGLGTHTLAAGQHRLRFTAVGRNPASAGTAFGLDALELVASE